MSGKAKRAAFRFGLGAAALLGIVALLLALAVLRPRWILPLVERGLAPPGGRATLAGLEITLAPPAVTLAGLTVVGPAEGKERLELGALRLEVAVRGLLGSGPWLRSVEASGLSYERLRPRRAAGAPDLTPLEWLFRIERLSVDGVRMRVALPWGTLAAQGVSVSVRPGERGTRRFRGEGTVSLIGREGPLAQGTLEARGEAEPGPALAIALTVGVARLDLPWLGGALAGRAALTVTPGELRAEELSLAMPGARLGAGPKGTLGAVPVRLDAAGSIALDGRNPLLSVRALEIGDLLHARGRASGPDVEALGGTAEGTVRRVERLADLLPSAVGGRMQGVELRGDLSFRADLAPRGPDRVLALALRPRALLVSLPRTGVDGRLEGAVSASGSLRQWRAGEAVLDGSLRGTASLSSPPVRVRGVRLHLPLSGPLASPALRGLRISAEEGTVSFDGRTVPLGAVEVRGSAAAGSDFLRLDDLDIRSEALGRLAGAVALRGGRVEGRLEGRGLEARALPPLAAVVSGLAGAPWTSEGAFDLAAHLAPDGEGTHAAAEVAMTRIGFASPSGDLIGRNLGGRFAVDAKVGSRARFAAELAIETGEVLWNTVYVDLAGAPLAARAGLSRTGPGRYEDVALEGEWRGIGSVHVEAGARREEEGWRHRGSVLLRSAHLGSLFRTFLRDPLAPSHPALAGLEMDGSSRLELSFSGSERAADLTGRLALHVDHLRREGEPSLVSGLDVDLPIAYALGAPDPGMPAPPGESGWGRLRLEALRLAGREIGPVETPLALVPNRLHFAKGVDASLFGARVELRRLRVEEPLSPSARATMSVRVTGLDLSRLPGGKVPLEGRLEGMLDPVSIGREGMRAEGGLSGTFFGGRMEIDNVAVERPFSPGREIGADVVFDRVDMEGLTGALGIGRITGRLSGSMDDLRVAYGQPVAFRLRMESVPEKGVRQLVSLKAVNSISLLSTGSALGGAGFSLMRTFFRQFPYAEIGIACSLENDVFTVRGLIHEDGVEYLVKKPFLAGINVINRTPDNRIGFSDMMERLKRVTAGDTLEEGGVFPPGGPAGVEPGWGLPGGGRGPSATSRFPARRPSGEGRPHASSR